MSAEHPVATSAATRPQRAPAILVATAVIALLLVIGGVLTLVNLDGSATATTGQNALVGRTIPAFTEQSVDGRGTVVAPWASHHAAVLLFFGNFCTICHIEVRTFGRVLGLGRVGAVRIVGIDGDQWRTVAQGFVNRSGVRFPVAFDGSLVLSNELAPAGFPTTVFVTKSGRVVAVDYGAISLMQLSAGLSQIPAAQR